MTEYAWMSLTCFISIHTGRRIIQLTLRYGLAGLQNGRVGVRLLVRPVGEAEKSMGRMYLAHSVIACTFSISTALRIISGKKQSLHAWQRSNFVQETHLYRLSSRCVRHIVQVPTSLYSVYCQPITSCIDRTDIPISLHPSRPQNFSLKLCRSSLLLLTPSAARSARRRLSADSAALA